MTIICRYICVDRVEPLKGTNLPPLEEGFATLPTTHSQLVCSSVIRGLCIFCLFSVCFNVCVFVVDKILDLMLSNFCTCALPYSLSRSITNVNGVAGIVILVNEHSLRKYPDFLDALLIMTYNIIPARRYPKVLESV